MTKFSFFRVYVLMYVRGMSARVYIYIYVYIEGRREKLKMAGGKSDTKRPILFCRLHGSLSLSLSLAMSNPSVSVEIFQFHGDCSRNRCRNLKGAHESR